MNYRIGFIFCLLVWVFAAPCWAGSSSRPEVISGMTGTVAAQSSETVAEPTSGSKEAGLVAGIRLRDYGHEVLYLPGPKENLTTVTGVAIGDNQVVLRDPDVKLTFQRAGGLGQDLMPTVNVTGNDLSAGEIAAAEQVGLDVSFAELMASTSRDIRVYASKLIDWLPKPLMINFGVRKSESAYSGRYGFDQDRDFVMEGNIMAYFSDKFRLGAEYRQKPRNYSKVSGLATPDHDWLSLVAAYKPSRNTTVSGGFFNFGDVLSSYDNSSFGMKVRLDF